MNKILLFVFFFCLITTEALSQVKPVLGTTSNFTVLAGSNISNSGNTVIYDNIGIWPGAGLTGFPPGVVIGAQHINNPTAQAAQTDLTTAYNQITAQPQTANLTGQDLGGKTLLPGVYKLNGNANLDATLGALTLDGGGNANSVFIFQISGNLTTSPNAVVSMRQAARSPNIFWQVGGSVFIGAGTNFNGSILANQNITFGNGAILQGRLMSRTGIVELNNNQLTIPPPRFNSDISIVKTVSPGPYYVGHQIRYTIAVKNLGPNNETNLLVRDLLPAGLTFVNYQTTNNIPYNANSGYWSLDKLANGNSDTLVINAIITTPNQITNTASVAGDGIDNNPTNNISNVNLCASPVKPGNITGPAVVCIGTTNSTYSIPAVPGATGYTWSVPTGWTVISGQNTNSITLAPGTDTTFAIISVTALNICGESLSSTRKIIPSPLPPTSLPPIAGNPIPCVNTTGNVYSIPAQTGVKNYTWVVPSGWIITAGQGTNSITVTAGTTGGIISVNASNDCGVSPVRTLNVSPSPLSPITPGPITPSQAGSPCAGQTNLIYTISSIPNASNYTWTVPAGWTIVSGQGTTTITVTAGSVLGQVSVSASNGCGSSPSSTLTVVPVTSPPAQPGPITGETVPCINQGNLTYSVPPQNGASTYTWIVPAGWTIIAGQGKPTITVSAGTSAGTISVTSTNGCGSSTTGTLLVTPATNVPPSPSSIISSASGSPCAGQTNLTYSLVPVSGASSYNWTVPTGWTITGGQGTPTITVTAGSTAGLITGVATNGCGNSIATTLALTPTATPPPTPGTIAGNMIPCVGSTSNTYNIPIVTGATNYTWAVPAGWVITSGQGTTTITVTAGSTNGNISVTASNGCGSGSASLMPVAPATIVPPVPGPIRGTTDICVSQTKVSYSISAVSGASGYVWTVPAGWLITYGQGTDSITVTTGTTPGNISVVATNGCGSGAASTLTLTPTSNPPVAPGTITGNLVPCTGQSNVIYTIPAVTGASGYNWTVPSGWVITAGQGTNTITVTTSTNAGSVSVSALNGCGAGAASTIAVNPSSTAAPRPGAITGLQVPCIGQTSVTYTIAAVAGASVYNWSVPAGWVISSGQGTTTLEVIAGSVAGNILVTAANGCGTGVASTLAVTPVFTPPVAPAAIIGNSVPCSAGGSLTYSVPVMPNVSAYDWVVPAGWNITAGQGTNTITVTAGSAAGIISVTATNGCGTGPATSLNVMVSTITPPTPGPISAPFSGSPCSGQANLVYSIGAVTGASAYNWTVPAGWVITSGQGTTSIEVTAGNTAGTVSVAATNGCGTGGVSTLATTPTTTPPISSGTITGTLVPCSGNSATRYTTTSVTGVTSYMWTVPAGWVITSGQGTLSIVATPDLTAGNITVTASNGCGAGSASTLAVTPTTLLPVLAGPITGNTNICSGETGLQYTVTPGTGASSYNWTLPAGWIVVSGQGTPNIHVKAGPGSGDISVVAENDCGLSASVTLPVTVKPSLKLNGNIKNEGSVCSGLRYSVEPNADASSYEWTLPAGWKITNGAGTHAIEVTAVSDTGTVRVIARNGGCASQELRIKANAGTALEPVVPNAFSPNQDRVNDAWVIKNLENYPDNEVSVINRWGNEVYKQKNYRNNWDGQNLSPGTYYYVVRVKLCNNLEKTYKGFVMIIR